MTAANDLARMVPGFEFLQNLMKGAGAALPGVQGFGQWVAPTLDPAELEKRISELKTVQFWLEQNARLLGTTIQALEVQRMTLSTLQTMNLPMADLRDALMARMPVAAPAEPAAAPPEPVPEPAPPPAPPPATGGIDPMQWWGALTQQFTEIAAKVVQDGSAAAMAPANPVKPVKPVKAVKAGPARKATARPPEKAARAPATPRKRRA